MLSNLVRLPLIFVSGIFMPLAAMPEWARWLAQMSPLSYAADLIRIGFGETGYWSGFSDIVALAGFFVLFFAFAHRFHLRSRDQPV